MAKSTGEKVPKQMQSKFDEISVITDTFCDQHLNAEYAEMSRKLTAALCRKRPSPLVRGKAKTWACGVVHALGMVNFLYDPSQTPHIKATELYKLFGVGQSTGQGKSKQIRDMMNMSQLSPDWCLPSRIEDNPMIWMLSVNGLIMDIRNAPYGAQVEALERGLIPYIPGDRKSSSSPQTKVARNGSQQNVVYVLEIFLLDGLVTEAFIEKNPIIARTIEISSEETLADLHQIIFEAFDREDEHMYEFQIGGMGPNDPEALRYGLSMKLANGLDSEEYVADVRQTKIGTLDLEQDEAFGYWFDFGDDWWHQIDVTEVKKKAPKKKYPIITSRTGDSPPQYPNWDEEDLD